MINYDKELNEEQLAVVKNGDGACLVLAGAGSGKTRTVTFRVAYLLEHGTAPEDILLVTFTNKAAREMVERITTVLGGDLKLPWAGTFHHIAYKLLRKYAPLLGYKNNFTILDSEDSKDMIKLCVKSEGVDKGRKRFPSPAVLFGLISYARNSQLSIEEVLDQKHPQWLDQADTIARIRDDYGKRKQEANAMDFDDLLMNLYLLLKKAPQIQQRLANQFRYVMVDEYQDTNTIQAAIVRELSSVHKNLLVVGDDAQSIYSFRAADIDNILSFEKHYPNAKVFRLETNYRSTPEILALANDVISNNVEQYQKELQSVRDSFVKPEVHVFAEQQEEAEFIATRILELIDEGIPLRQVAVLFRAAYHSQAIEMELTKRDIPYEYRGGVRFFERAHIKDVLAYLRVYHNPTDMIAWSRLLNMQVGIGPATAQKIIGTILDNIGELRTITDDGETKPIQEQSLRQLPIKLSARAGVGWHDFLQIYAVLESADQTSTGLIDAVRNSRYTEYLETEYQDYRERLQDLEQLSLFSHQQPDIARFLAEASLQESYAKGKNRGPSDDDDAIVLSTIHQAKGLEWEVVFIVNVAQGQFPNDRALKEKKGIEEERRLFYVATTRAKKQLYLSYPLLGFRSQVMSGPSMFLDEMDKRLVNEHGMSGGTAFKNDGWSDPSDDIDDIVYISEDEEFKSPRRTTSFLGDF